ncbi:hypothetical protein MMC14_001311 [Varicellaria rhodocarpa]|nr:hypothetical protein [Varicellaria rhodocarpa]
MGFFYSQFFITPEYPKKSFSGQTVIVTGSNVGLGFEAARHFARLDAAKVILAVRNIPAGEKAKQSIEESTKRPGVCEVWKLDLASYDSVKAFATRASQLPRLDIVVENAAIATDKFSLAECHERSITVNVISTILLALLLLPKLGAMAKEYPSVTPHLTIVSSEVHGWTKFAEWKDPNIFAALSSEKTTSMGERYPTSKLLEVFAVRQMTKRFTDSGVVLNMLNPGLCHSELARDAGWGLWLLKLLFARTTEVGSRTLVAAASDESHGAYMNDGKAENNALSPFVKSEDGAKAQKKVWSELRDILEKIQPGVTDSI